MQACLEIQQHTAHLPDTLTMLIAAAIFALSVSDRMPGGMSAFAHPKLGLMPIFRKQRANLRRAENARAGLGKTVIGVETVKIKLAGCEA